MREELDVSFLRVQQAKPKTSSRGSGGVLIRMEHRRADRPIGARDRYVCQLDPGSYTHTHVHVYRYKRRCFT